MCNRHSKKLAEYYSIKTNNNINNEFYLLLKKFCAVAFAKVLEVFAPSFGSCGTKDWVKNPSVTLCFPVLTNLQRKMNL